MPVADRIISSEVEWGLLLDSNNLGDITLYELAVFLDQEQPEMLAGYVDPAISSSRDFLANGARYYRDSRHPEYSAPEHRSAKEAVDGEIAGEIIVLDSFLRMVRDKDTPIDLFQLNKRVVDDFGNFWGYHENYSGDANLITINQEGLALLGLHLATRNIWAGAGYVDRGPDRQPQYRLAQKAFGLSEDYGVGTLARHRPVVNLRDTPHADCRYFKRVHVTSGDAHMSPWSMLQTFGTTSLVIKMIEEGRDDSPAYPQLSLVQLGLMAASDLSFSRTYTCVDGKERTPTDAQEMLVEAAEQMSEDGILNEEQTETTKEWRRTVDRLRSDPASLADRADSFSKMQYYEAARDQLLSQGMSNEAMLKRLRHLDRMWDNAQDGIGMQKRQTDWQEWMPSDETLSHRIENPTTDTRAIKRRELIKRHQGNDSLEVMWELVLIDDKRIEMKDPFISS